MWCVRWTILVAGILPAGFAEGVRGADDQPDAARILNVAGLTTEYRHNAHADMFFTRLFRTDTLDDKGRRPNLKLVSVFTDQVPDNDISRLNGAKYGFRVFPSIRDALTLGTKELSVQGVLLIAEHGKYPESETGQFQFPKRPMFAEVVKTFRETGKIVPVFLDKHLADTWQDAKWIYDQSRELQIPMLAGSSLPIAWRYPPADVPRNAKLRQIVITSYHRLDSYGIHALEIVQALAERRAGGETGVKAVQCFSGDAVWEAERRGEFDRRLLDAALTRLKEKPIPPGKRIEDLAMKPHLLIVDYSDGLRACIVSLDYAVLEWAGAWSDENGQVKSTLFWTQELRPFMHFSHLLKHIETLMQTGQAPWPLERTLLTTGTLDALLQSKLQGGKRIETPWLDIRYQSAWNWTQPPEPPPGRPLTGQ